MQCISEEIVEQTWKSVAALEPETAAGQMMDFATAQPHLLGFVTAFLEEMQDDAREIGIYLLFVVYRMFETSAAPNPIPQIGPEAIKEHYEANQDLFDDVDAEDPKSLEEIAYQESSKQPFVFRYVTEVLLEEDEDEVPADERITLTEEEFGENFLVLKTVIDALDSAVA